MSAKYLLFAILWVICFHATFVYCAESDASKHPTVPNIESKTANKQGLSLTISGPKVMYSGAENYVTLILRNEGGPVMNFQSAAPQGLGIGFEVTRREKPVETTSWATAYLVPSIDQFAETSEQIKTGEELQIVVNLTRYFDLSVPEDTYQIRASWSGHIKGTLKGIALQTPPIDFKVSIKPGESPLGVQALMKKKKQ